MPGISSGQNRILPDRLTRARRPAMAVRRLNHAVLYVHDLASAVEFYTTALGFEVRTEIAGQAAFLRAPGSANDHDLGLFGIGGPPDLGAGLARWADRATGAAAGSVT